MTILTLLQIIFYAIAIPYIIGKMVNNLFKIENNDDTTNVWYTGILSLFFLFIISILLWSLFKFIVG